LSFRRTRRERILYYPQSHPLKSNNEASTEASPAGILTASNQIVLVAFRKRRRERILPTTHSPTHSNQIMKQALKLLRRTPLQILTATNQIALLLAFRRTRRKFYIIPTVPPTQIK
jgi:hypothetical protein